MKNLIFKLSTVFTVILLTISCNEQESGLLSEIDGKGPTNCNFTIVGQLHNDGLDAIYSYFITGSKWTESSMIQSLDSLVLSQREANNSNLSSPHWPLSNEDAVKIISIIKGNLATFLSNDPAQIKPILINEGLSTDNFNILLEIRNLLCQDYNDFNELLAAIELKETELINTGKFSYYIEEPLNILKASICYWGNSYEKWDEVSTSSIELRWCGHDWGWFWDSVNDMAEDDFWSGALGAVIGDGGGAVAGACYGSAASGIGHLFDGC